MKWNLIPVLLLFTGIVASCNRDKDDAASTIIKPVFESDRQEISAGDSIVFKDLSDGYVTKWNWTFAGGTPASSNLSKPTVTYSTPGIYEVTLELSNAANQVVISKKDYIRVDFNQVQADFNASIQAAYIGDQVVFRDSTSGGPVNWQWEFVPVSGGTTLTSTEQNPSLSFTDTGYYQVSLTASNPSYSNKKTKSNFIRIIDPNAVSADFSSEEKATYEGGSIQFTDKSLGNVSSWEWNIEGPVNLTSNEKNPVIQFTTRGRYKVSLKASNPNASTTKTVDNYIMVIPGAGLAAYFPFNGNIRDVGPNSVPSNSVGAGIGFTNADRFSQAGNTGTFNGATGVIVDDHNAMNFGTENFSIACWVKTGNAGRMMIWQESGKNGTGDNQAWLRMGDNATDRRLRFTVEDVSGSSIINMGASAFLADNQWHHVVAVRNGMVTAVYVDGVEVANRTTTNLKSVSNSQGFKIGIQEGAASNSSFFDGEIDDVIIYRKALSVSEIQALFNL
ncbi:LamG-like jellyroll fold domain-containing protein [Flavihumibacter solisilvae]|nr:PKD domain-containing protein [Flavihumibacter solisilvae]